MSIPAGETVFGCSNCCPPCEAPYIAYVSRSASKSKSGCGYTSGGAVYLTQTETYNWTSSYPNPDYFCYGTTNYVQTNNYSISMETGECTGPTCTASGSTNLSYSDPEGDPNSQTYSGEMTSCGVWVGTVVSTFSDGTSRTDPWDDPAPPCPGTPTYTDVYTYSNEYTSTILMSATVASLPAWGALSSCEEGEGEGLELSSAELSTDGSSYSIMQSKYQWCFQASPTGCYSITWDETFTPDTGSPMSTPKSFTWDGTVPMGYDPTNPATWPVSTEYECDQPSSNGSVSISNLAYSCACPR